VDERVNKLSADITGVRRQILDSKVTVGASVKQGDLLLSFDLDGIVKEGFNPVTVIIITNRPDAKLEHADSRKISKKDRVLTINQMGANR